MTASMNLRAQQVSLADRVYAALLEALVTPRFRPGQRLDVSELARTFGVSETPVKQALVRLSAERLVEFVPGKGPHVVKVSERDIVETLQARLMCELFAVSQGWERLDDEFIARLQQIEREAEEVAGWQDPAQYRLYLSKNKEFHQAIVSLCGNQVIQDWYANLNNQFRLHVGIRVYAWQSKSSPVVEHREIVAAFAARDRERVERALRVHLANAQERLLHQVVLPYQDEAKGGDAR